MELDRRSLLLAAPVSIAAATVVDSPTSDFEIDASALAQHLGASPAAVTGAISRLERFMPGPAGLILSHSRDLGLGCDFQLDAGTRCGQGRWRFTGATEATPSLDGAVALLCGRAAAVVAESGGATLRWVAGCAFGGLTLLVYKARQTTVAVFLKGHHYGRPPAQLRLNA